MTQYKSAKQVARDLICDHAFEIEYMSIGEAMDTMMRYGEGLPEMTDDEFDAFQSEVDRWINKASISVQFEED